MNSESLKLLILAAVLALMQTGAPVPKGPSNGTAQRTGDANNRSSNDKIQPANASPALNVQQDSGRLKGENDVGRTTTQNTQEAIIVKESPGGSKSRKDWWDRFYVIFTGLLVLVGGLGAGYALRTLKAIRQQSDAIMNAERAWMVAQMENLPEPYQPEQAVRMACHIKNMGRTAAFLVSKGERKEIVEKAYQFQNSQVRMRISRNGVEEALRCLRVPR